MGTTVTTNLGLIKPDEDEKIQEDLPTFAGWAAQNEQNCDTIDALFRHDYASYSPAWTADTTNPVLGAGGSVTGKYVRLWPRMVIGNFMIATGGAGFSAGSGLYRLSLPVAMDPDIIALGLDIPVGKAYLHDDSAVATSTVVVVLYDTVNDVFFFRKHDGNAWRNNTPFTLAQQDRLAGYFMYATEVT